MSGQFPVLQEIRALVLVALLAVLYLVVMAAAMAGKKYSVHTLVDTLPSAVFNSIVMMAGIVESMYGMSYIRLTGYAIGTGIGYFLATMLIQEAIDNVGNPDMPEAFVGLPSLLIYIGILAMAFTGFNGGPSVFL
jgi:Na+-translocating ferredoxin:NAD+ oxidoreductase RnfA subunit